VIVGFGRTLIDSAPVPLCKFLSVTLSVKLEPAAVGVPLITPVPALRSRPAGNAPLTTNELYVLMPPVATTVVL